MNQDDTRSVTTYKAVTLRVMVTVYAYPKGRLATLRDGFATPEKIEWELCKQGEKIGILIFSSRGQLRPLCSFP